MNRYEPSVETFVRFCKWLKYTATDKVSVATASSAVSHFLSPPWPLNISY